MKDLVLKLTFTPRPELILKRLCPESRILCIGEGEARNTFYLATPCHQGLSSLLGGISVKYLHVSLTLFLFKKISSRA